MYNKLAILKHKNEDVPATLLIFKILKYQNMTFQGAVVLFFKLSRPIIKQGEKVQVGTARKA